MIELYEVKPSTICIIALFPKLDENDIVPINRAVIRLFLSKIGKETPLNAIECTRVVAVTTLICIIAR